jgi:hypothetical protein
MITPSRASSGVEINHGVKREQSADIDTSNRSLRRSDRAHTQLREPAIRSRNSERTLPERARSSQIFDHRATLVSSKRTFEQNSNPPASTLESTGAFVTPVVGSEEWNKQETENEARDHALNKQIHGICKGC